MSAEHFPLSVFDRIIIAILMMLGALPAAVAMVASTVGEYEYFLPYRYAGYGFFLFSLLGGLFVYPNWNRILKIDSVFIRMLLTAMIAYGSAWLCLAVMNFTSLCIGLDNGDGNNSTAHCAAGTILNGIVFAVVALLGNLPAAAIYSYINRRRRR